MLQLAEQLLRDAVVVALTVPLRLHLAARVDAARIAAADMQPESHAGKTFDHRIFGPDRPIEILLRILAAGPHAFERDLVHIGGETRRVHVHIAAARVHQFADHHALDRDHVGNEFIETAIDRL